ncbi:MAG: tRNA adenosine(34) deaminase TadA [Clostridia bacterium]|nr:tRNA adenosine(34) deaminase TadA [Clostridia bacterium]MBR5767956.1 tRNA adenosine(34) deaminase TadA [Clostridia bacterium]
MTDEEYMRAALCEARIAADEGETPVGAVIVRNGEIIASAHNTRERSKNALHHAEMLCIDEACRRLGGWRLPGCTLYVTLEPCPMCAGAVINSRIVRVVFGAPDAKAGSFGSVTDLSSLPYNHRPEIKGGVLADECAGILSDFFTDLRAKSKEK